MPITTLTDVFFTIVDRNSDCVLMHKQDGDWTRVGGRQLYREVVSTARALQSWNIHKGDRVAILAENRPEWAVADFATMLIGAVTVPIYPTLTAEQIAWLLTDAGVKVLFLSTIEQLKKFREIESRTPVQKVVIAAVPDLSKTCNSTMELESAPVPVSVTDTAIVVVAPGTNVDGFGVAVDLNVRFEFTAIVVAEEFQFHN